MRTPRPVEFRSFKQLVRRLHANRQTETAELISADDADDPSWQRQLVWTDEDMGLLVYSILRGYPIGQIILWKKPNGIRVPIDRRQRLTAIKRFAEGNLALPTLRHIPREFVELGLSQTEMAKALGLKINYSAVGQYERATREPTLLILLKYARLVGVSTDILIDDKLDIRRNVSDDTTESQ